MRRSSKKLPKDPNKLAYEIVRLSTEDPEEPKEAEIPTERSAISEYLATIGRKGGLKRGGQGGETICRETQRNFPKGCKRKME